MITMMGEAGPVRLGPIDIADTILIDSGVDPEMLVQLRSHAREVVVVDN